MLTRLADAYLSVGNLAAAESTYRKNLDDGYDKFSLLGLAKVHAVRSETTEVVHCYRQLIANEGESGRFFGEIVSKMIEYKWESDAISLYQVACEMQKNNLEVCQNLAIQAKKFNLPLYPN